MIIKSHELSRFDKKNTNYYLFYGSNLGLIEETISKIFKPIFSKNIVYHDETEILNNTDQFKEAIFNKSFFENDKFIIINRASNKILDLIKEIIESQIEDIKIIIKAGVLEKKSKLRSYFEKEKNVVATPFYEDNYQSLSLIIQNFLRVEKINISNENINLIIERSKGNRTNIYNELEKISSYLRSKKNINLQDLLKLTNLAEDYNVSELVEQCLSKNVKRTINILNENNQNTDENILILRSFLGKLKRLKILKINLENTRNIDEVIASAKPPIFWKEKNLVKQQLNNWSLKDIKFLLNTVNDLELIIKKNNQISNYVTNNFILESLRTPSNLV
jgi:DNA polymerase-3 subunit delta